MAVPHVDFPHCFDNPVYIPPRLKYVLTELGEGTPPLPATRHVCRKDAGISSATSVANSMLGDPYCTAVLAKQRSDVPSDPQSSGILRNKVIRGEVFGRLGPEPTSMTASDSHSAFRKSEDTAGVHRQL